jgi:DNA-binding CsgD family transcriptional regulator/PAS domain-containing protein
MPAVEARPLGSLCDKSTFDRTDFYNNVVRPDGGFDGLLAVPFRQDGHIGVLAVERLRTAPDYDGDDVDALQAVLPHLSNALRIRLKLEDADAAAQQTYGAFDLLDFGVIVVDARMRPVFMNRRAERVTSCNDGLSVGRDGLRAARAEETDTLRRAVRAAIETATLKRRNGQEIDKVEPYAVRLRLLRPSREPALVATVMPLSPENGERLIAPQARAVIFVVQPSQPLSLDSAAVEAAFGLTPRQAALAVLIARGASLPQAAATLSTSSETVRSHLKEIFERTGTRRQADLVRMLSVAFSSIAVDETSE